MKIGEPLIRFWPQRNDSFDSDYRCWCQVSSKLDKNCDRESTQRQRWHCYSHGTWLLLN